MINNNIYIYFVRFLEKITAKKTKGRGFFNLTDEEKKKKSNLN